MHADLGRGVGLVAHIDLRGGIIAGENHREPRLYSALHKRRDLALELGADRRREGFSIEDLRCHGAGAV